MVNTCQQLLVKEFRPSSFCLCYSDWRAFTYSAWLPQKWQFQWIFLIYRWLLAAYYFAWLFPSGLDSSNGGPKFFIYLTNWTQLSWTTYLIVAAVSVTVKLFQVHLCCRERYDTSLQEEENFFEPPQGCCAVESDETSWYQNIQWVLFTIGAEAACAISLLYWLVIYDGNDDLDGVNLNTHLTNGILAILDLWFSKTPVRLLHGVYIIAYAAAYSVFTGIYHAADGKNAEDEPYVYEVLDYKDDPGTATGYILGVVLVFVPLVHLAFYLQYLARYWITYTLFRGLRRRGHSNLDTEGGESGYDGDHGGGESTEETEIKL